MKINIPEQANKIIDILENAGFEAYVVGGCVRDSLLNKEPKDWDITTSAKPEHFKSRKHSVPKFYQDNVKIQFTDTHVKVEGFATSKKKNRQKLNWIRLAEHKRIPTNTKYFNPRIKFDGINWWITIGIEYEDSVTIPSGDGIGIDVGIKDFAICSDKYEYKNRNKSHKVKKLEKRKRRLQRSISRRYEMNKKGGRQSIWQIMIILSMELVYKKICGC